MLPILLPIGAIILLANVLSENERARTAEAIHFHQQANAQREAEAREQLYRSYIRRINAYDIALTNPALDPALRDELIRLKVELIELTVLL